MKFSRGIPKKYRKSVEDAFETILEHGNDTHRRIAHEILESKMLVRVEPVSKINELSSNGVYDIEQFVHEYLLIAFCLFAYLINRQG